MGFLQEEGQVFNLCLHGWTWGIRNVFLKDAGFQYLKTNQDGSTPATGNHTVDWQILKANDEAIIRALSSIAACAPLALTVDAPHFRQKFTACHPDPCLGVIVLYFFDWSPLVTITTFSKHRLLPAETPVSLPLGAAHPTPARFKTTLLPLHHIHCALCFT